MEGLQGSPSHGLAITPDGKLLWATSKWYHSVMAYSLPDYKLLKVVKVGSHPDWLTITPDGKSLYVAVAGDDETVVVDNKTMTVVRRLRWGRCRSATPAARCGWTEGWFARSAAYFPIVKIQGLRNYAVPRLREVGEIRLPDSRHDMNREVRFEVK